MAQYNVESKKFVDRNNKLFDTVILADPNGNVFNNNLMNNINVSNGLIPGVSFFNHFGAVPEMAQSASGTIWDINNTFYPWNSLETAGIVTVNCTNSLNVPSTLDNGMIIIIQGLDNDYNMIEEEVTITESIGISTLAYKRVNNVYAITDNKTNINLVINSVTVQRISIGKGRSLSTTYTIPAGYTGYLTQGTSSCAAASDGTIDMYIRKFGYGFINSHTLEVSGMGGQYIYPFTVPIAITEKSDIDIRVHVRNNKARITASYDIILVKNEG